MDSESLPQIVEITIAGHEDADRRGPIIPFSGSYSVPQPATSKVATYGFIDFIYFNLHSALRTCTWRLFLLPILSLATVLLVRRIDVSPSDNTRSVGGVVSGSCQPELLSQSRNPGSFRGEQCGLRAVGIWFVAHGSDLSARLRRFRGRSRSLVQCQCACLQCGGGAWY